ncbi:MAG TPA: L,D-transpeptidase family protein [Phototrophicaceae bacterium]|nr:L,D-transpeptidase family protein [Phototrophicaceae bacterium]
MTQKAARIPPAPPNAARQRPAQAPAARRAPRRKFDPLMVLMIVAPLLLIAVVGLIVVIGGLFVIGGSTVLPGVSAAGIPLSGLSLQQAETKLQSGWKLTLSAGQRSIPVDPATLGITLDAQATAQQAISAGRSHGSLISAIIGRVDLPPVVHVDLDVAAQGLTALSDQINQAPVNAGVTLVNGTVQPRAAAAGQSLDVNATLAQLQQNAAGTLASGTLKLVLTTVQPTVTDSSAVVQAAGALLANPLNIQLYDPISNASLAWSVPPQTWSAWLTSGVSGLSFDPAQVTSYLDAQQSQLPSGDYLNTDESITAMQAAIGQNNLSPRLRIYHHDSQHVVQPGETLISIAWNVGIPYPWIQQANPGVDQLSVGQSITIPSPDHMLSLPLVWDKRIDVSITQQRVRVYENGALKWDWIASTGEADSPTWPGIYQVLLHDPDAYAANWNLYMPNFLGVYHPVPGVDFTNGFHGFPTRGNSQLLWTNDLGTRVTYGCILLSNENAQTLYNWAQDGVVVEIDA